MSLGLNLYILNCDEWTIFKDIVHNTSKHKEQNRSVYSTDKDVNQDADVSAPPPGLSYWGDTFRY